MRAYSCGSPMTRRPSRWTPLMRFGPLMSRRAMRRTLGTSILVPDGVSQLPRAVVVAPEMGRPERIGEVVEVGAVHQRLLEHRRGPRELLRWNAEVAEDLLGEAIRELAVEALRRGDL